MRAINQNTGKTGQSGFASIVVALTLLIVLSLLTVGFAQLARHEQKNSLTRQLSDQAYYAAEAGFNDALQDVRDGNITDTNASATQCMTPVGSSTGYPHLAKTGANTARTASPAIDPNNDIAYTCLMVDLHPSNLQWSGVGEGQSRFIKFSTNGALNSLTVNWGSDDGHSTFVPTFTGGKFYSQANWGSSSTAQWPAVLQVSITPLGNMSRDALIANTFNAYLYPSSVGGGVAVNVSNSANNFGVYSGHCDSSASATYPCKVTFTGFNGVPGESYELHFVNYYDKTDVLVNNATSITASPLKFTGQVVYDVTGKARNVLKRIRVTMPADTNASLALPRGPLDGQSICKRMGTYTPAAGDGGYDPYRDEPYGNNVCNLSLDR